jgi:hypothetical protein
MNEKDIIVACVCGWQGRQSELIPVDAEGSKCPVCDGWFEKWPSRGNGQSTSGGEK